jgi:D-alanyl-lipoteichoic acid acyltransferase DltB (MBOAT superfamily)
VTFTSLNFLVFFPAVAVAFYALPARYRWISILFASYFFYINIKPVFVVLLAGITLSTYIMTRLIDDTTIEQRKRNLMVINIVFILLPLFFYKYFGAINANIIDLMGSFNLRWPLPEISLLLPVGISFYTFMAIGYTVDVYNEEIKAEKNIGIVALFISFFPLILSGPIERAGNMIPQFKKSGPLNFDNIVSGMKIMLWGYFMKLVVADRLGIYIDGVYNDLGNHNGTSVLIASGLYPFQVYADLGGYSLIAIGTAKVLGFDVMQNFRRPFFATTMSDFWRRWHISLISWLTDYIYTPLSFTFRKMKVWGIVIALLVTFVLSGLWHGATLPFLLWGLMQGIFLSLEALTAKRRNAIERRFNLTRQIWYIIPGIFLTFLMFSSTLMISRLPDMGSVILVYKKLLFSSGMPYLDFTTLSVAMIGLTIILIKDFKDEYFPGRIQFFNNKYIAVRYSSYILILFMVLLLGVFSGNSFIYFQF